MNSIIRKIKYFNFVNITQSDSVKRVVNTFYIPEKTKKNYTEQGIDVKSLLKRTLEDEMYQTISKKLFNDITSLSSISIDVDFDSILVKKKREDNITKLLDLPQIPDYSSHSIYRDYHTAFNNELFDLCNKIKPNVIFSNGRLTAVIQDLQQFRQVEDLNKVMLVTHGQYLIGEIFGVNVYTDAYMRYDDNRLVVGNVNIDFIHDNKLRFSDDYTELSYGYDILTKKSSKVGILNIIDDNSLLG